MRLYKSQIFLGILVLTFARELIASQWSFDEVVSLDSVLANIKLAYKNQNIAILIKYTNFPLRISVDGYGDKIISNEADLLANRTLIFNEKTQRIMGCVTVDKLNQSDTGYSAEGQIIEISSRLVEGNKKVRHGLSLISDNPKNDRFIDDVCGVIGEWERQQWELISPPLDAMKRAYKSKDIYSLSELVEYPLDVYLLNADSKEPHEKKYATISGKQDMFSKRDLVFNDVMARFVNCLTPQKFYRYKSFKGAFNPQDFLRPVVVGGSITKYRLKGIVASSDSNVYIDKICEDSADPRPFYYPNQ